MINFIKMVLKSKTLIIAWITFAIGLLGYVGGQDIIPQEVAMILLQVSAFLQFVVRFLTNVPVWEKKSLNKRK